ncbi:hypothetical protein ABMA28_004868 [Loxostege sticticalis]|uniref:Reverse transcriptase n=1 Tax=Loxostege sticticalis TaxID=481309 RepID=A0ABD0ST99_LOXSC
MAVSFDIANAFNSIPHSAILEALRYHGVPTYLRSLAAACALAGTPPWELEASVLSAVYHWTAEQRARDLRPAPEERGAVRRHAHEDMVRDWEGDLSRAQFGRRTLDAIGPNLDRWLERPHGFLTYRLVQVLTGHGCFGNYLHKIGREESPSCHECGAAVDSAQHTLAVCPGWEEQRRVLVGAVGQDLSLPSIVNAMLDDERAWKAMASFCETRSAGMAMRRSPYPPRPSVAAALARCR